MTTEAPERSAPAPALEPAGSPILRIAIAGGGKMARHHAGAIGRLGQLAQVTAVADPSEAAREAMLEVAGAARAYPDLASLLAAEAIDVVHVVTPPATHDAMCRQALEAGAHVYVEKPFTETAAEAEGLLSLARARARKVCAGHQLLYEPPAARAAELLPALGSLVHVESYFSFRPVRRNPDGRTPLRPDLQLLDILPHPVYLLLRFLGGEDRAPELGSLELGPGGTVHAHLRQGGITGSLVVTLEGRPIESYLRLVGTNGSVFADFVRGTVQSQIGPGTSGIDKLLAPYRQARQLFTGTTGAMARRFLRRQRSYPGLRELFEAFYRAVREDLPSPIPPGNILETVRVCERVAGKIAASRGPEASARPPKVLVTGGTGLLGREVVRELLQRGDGVRVLARRLPAPWDRLAGAEYLECDLGGGIDPGVFNGIETVVHCAAETAGGWEEHQRNSIDATGHVLRAAAAAGARRVIHVSSLAVLAGASGGRPLSEASPLEPDSRGLGPYVWGKLESEKLAVALGQELGLEVKVVRPGALVDYRNFDPPGRLGKRLGGFFVAVGSRRHRLGVVDVQAAARALVWMAKGDPNVPTLLNLLTPDLPTKRDLVARVRASNPHITVVWLPTAALLPLSGFAILLQKLLRPGRPAINAAKVFSGQSYNTDLSRQILDHSNTGHG